MHDSAVISARSVPWWVYDQPSDQCKIATWSVHDQSHDQCMIATWAVHTITWSVHAQSRDQCMRATWWVRDHSRDRCVISDVNSACSVTCSGPAELRDFLTILAYEVNPHWALIKTSLSLPGEGEAALMSMNQWHLIPTIVKCRHRYNLLLFQSLLTLRIKNSKSPTSASL